MLVDTEGLVLKAKVHSAKLPDEDGIKLLLESARGRLPRLSHLWVDAGYRGRGKRWAEEGMGLSGEVVRRPRKPVPEGGGGSNLGERVGQGRPQSRVAEVHAPAGVRDLTPQMGRGAHVCLAGSEQKAEQGLRKAVRHR